MSKPIQVIYEDNVLKPLSPLTGLREHEKAIILICRSKNKRKLKEIAGTLSHEEAEEMKKIVEDAFERTEGDW